MGLQIEANLPGTGSALEAVARALTDQIEDQDLRALARVSEPAAGELHVWLHPASEPVELAIRGDRLVCSAKTSPAGPGYHAFLVDLLERSGWAAGVSWRWSGDGDSHLGDETGYHEAHDFAALQAEMLAWLRELARWAISEPGVSSVGLCMPLGLRPIVAAPAHSPMGLWEASWLEAAARGTPEQLRGCGASFFPWWDRDVDATFWKNFGAVIAWTDVPWHVPADEAETRIYRQAIAAFRRSRQLDPFILLPDLDIAEMELLAKGDPEAPLPPRPTGIGFRRGDVDWPLPGGWCVRLPGSWYQSDDDGTIGIWTADRAVYASTYTADGLDRHALLERRGRDAGESGGGQLVDWRDERHVARARLVHQEEASTWQLRGQVCRDDGFAHVTISFSDPADRAWAEGVFRSIRS